MSGKPVYRPSWGTRCLLWVAGVDPELLSSRVECYRAASMGVFVIIVALLGSVTFSLYVTVIAGRWLPWVVPFAAFWAVILFWLDRSILVDPHYGSLRRAELQADAARSSAIPSPWPPPAVNGSANGSANGSVNGSVNGYQPGAAQASPSAATPKPKPRPRRDFTPVLRTFVYLSRVAIAVIVAILISEVAVLLIFRPEIKTELLTTQNGSFQGKIAALAAKQQVALGLQISDLNARIKANTATLAIPKQIMDAAQSNYLAEKNGQTASMTPGEGPLAGQDLDIYQQAADAYTNDVAQVDGENTKLSDDITTLTAEKSAYGNPSSAAFTALDSTPAGKQAYAETHDTAGWLDQETAFGEFQRTHGGFAVRWIPWLIRGLLVLIDLLPLGLKLLSGASVYGRRVRDEGQLTRYADRRQQLGSLIDLDRGADLRDYRTGLTSLLAYEAQEKYRRDRTDHLGRPYGGFR